MKRKLVFFLLSILILLPLIPINSPTAEAATCTGWAKSVASDSESIKDTDKQIRLRIEVGAGAGENAVILVKRSGEANYSTVLDINDGLAQIPLYSDISDGLLEEVIGFSNPYYMNGGNNQPFPVGKYTLALAPDGSTNDNEAYCVLPNFFEVTRTETGADGFCTISFDDSNNYTIVNNGNDPVVRIKATFPSGSHNGVHRVRLIFKGNERDVNPSPDHSDLDRSAGQVGWKIPHFWEPGEYRVRLIEHNRLIDEGRSCTSVQSFVINTEDKGGGHLCTEGNMSGCNSLDTDTSPNASLAQPCRESDLAAGGGGCKRIKTAFGYVSTDASNFTRWILGFILSISGGIVVLIILITGYRLMTSQGDPEKVKNAKDQLTAAIIGLMFIIFSLAILELITRDILGLPGFG